MQKGLVAMALAGVLGGVVGSGVTVAITRGFTPRADRSTKEATPSQDARARPARARGEPDATAERVALLERRVRLLTAALAQRGSSGGSATRHATLTWPTRSSKWR